MEKKQYLTIGNIIGETFNFYFKNFLWVCLPYLIVIFPFEQLEAILNNASNNLRVMSISLFIINMFLSNCVTFYLILVILKRYNNEEVNIKATISSVFPRLLPYIFLNIIIFLSSILLTFLLVIPGIIYIAATSIADIIMVREGLGIRASLKRSRALTKKKRFKIVVSMALLICLMLMLFAIYCFLLGFSLNGGISQFIELASISEKYLGLKLAYSLVFNCLVPLYSIMSVVIYINLLKEKEGFETEQLADSFLEENNE